MNPLLAIVLSFLFFVQLAIAQNTKTILLVDTTQVTVRQDTVGKIEETLIDSDKINLPPVSAFLEAAESYADVQYYAAKTKEEEELLKISQKDWLKYIRLQANYQYGTNNTYVLQSGGELTPTGGGSLTRNTQNWYNLGVALSVPLDDVFSRKNKNNVIKARIEQGNYELERSLEDRRIVILKAYNDVIKNLALLKVNAESVALYDAQMRISETDFINGQIDIISLSLERARKTEANIKYQESRAALHNAVTILEMLTGIKIIK